MAIKHQLPAVYPFRFFTVDGGLASYGPDQADQYQRAASYVDHILRGTKPADLPVQAPTKFEFVINQMTAKMLGTHCAPDASQLGGRGNRMKRGPMSAIGTKRTSLLQCTCLLLTQSGHQDCIAMTN